MKEKKFQITKLSNFIGHDIFQHTYTQAYSTPSVYHKPCVYTNRFFRKKAMFHILGASK